MSHDDDDDRVGYRRPPKQHRFTKGQSGNPNGRPKKPKPEPVDRSPAAVLRRADERRISLNGREYTPFELEVMALQGKAAKGDVAASRQLGRLRMQAGLLKPEPRTRGGVLVLPAAPENIEDFEAAAFRQQAQFRERSAESPEEEEGE